MFIKLTNQEFIKKSIDIFGPNIFDYEKTNYLRTRSEVCITCKQHGDFNQTPKNHLSGINGCKQCQKEKIDKKWTNEKIIESIKNISKNGISCGSKNKTLYKIAKKRFSSWSNACKMAGVVSNKDRPIYEFCTIPGCANKVRSQRCKWCEMHYGRNRRHGDPDKLILCQYTVDVTLYDTWTEENAWLLGLLWTDGYMYENSVGVKLKDIQLIETAKIALNTNISIKTAIWKNKKYKFFSIASKPLAERLKQIGMHPSKTFTIEYPKELPQELFGHFMRGVIDGDGTIYLGRKRNRQTERCQASFVTASLKFAKQMMEQLTLRNIKYSLSVRKEYLKNGNKNKSWTGNDIYNIIICNLDSLRKLYEIMYPKYDLPCLHRKRDEFHKFYTTPRIKCGRPRSSTNIEHD